MAGIIRFNNSESFCEATTLKGTQCRHMKQPNSKYCWAHGRDSSWQNKKKAESPRCKAITKGGSICKKYAQKGKRYCWNHKDTVLFESGDW